MNKLFKTIILGICAFLLFHACDTDIESDLIQKPLTADEQYYENLRNYKKTDHAVCFGWYDAYRDEDSPSMGSHFMGLPDSMDIVSLWGGVPQGKVLEEMYEVRRLKGTRFVLCTFCQAGDDYPHTEEGLRMMADSYLETIEKYDLDGLDIDYEPGGDYVQGENLTKIVKMLGKYLGPRSGTDKLLMIDYAGGNDYNTRDFPMPETEPYVNYFTEQMYSTELETVTPVKFQTRYNKISSWCPPEKFILTEQMGWHWKTGGRPYTEKGGNTLDSWGNPLYTLIGMARWNPEQGRKGGFGAYYFEYEYNTTRPANQSLGDKESKAIPYYSLRRGIQEQNPAAK